jgi:hypothetical protein
VGRDISILSGDEDFRMRLLKQVPPNFRLSEAYYWNMKPTSPVPGDNGLWTLIRDENDGTDPTDVSLFVSRDVHQMHTIMSKSTSFDVALSEVQGFARGFKKHPTDS